MPAAVTPPAETSPSRIIALDILRGYFILVIASVHLHYYPSLLGAFDGRGQLWVSEAEGFFFISGTVLGLIRHRDLVRNGWRVAANKLWLRARKLYIAAMILGAVYITWGVIMQSVGIAGAKPGLPTWPLWQTVLSLLTLRYTYGWADFLVYYVAFILVAPAALWLMARRLTWVVIAVTTAVWVWRWTGSHGALDPFIQWQMYFFMGLTLGYHWSTVTGWFGRLSQTTLKWLRRGAYIAAALIYIVSSLLTFVPEWFQNRDVPAGRLGSIIQHIIDISGNYVYSRLLVDGRIGLLRPLVWLVIFAALFSLVRRYEDQILRALGWLLVPFGSNSLYVYIVESFLLFTVPFFTGQSNFWINSLIEVAIVTIVWLGLRNRVLFNVIPR